MRYSIFGSGWLIYTTNYLIKTNKTMRKFWIIKVILIGAVAASILALIAMIPEVLFIAKAPDSPIGEAIKMLLSAFIRYPANIIASAVAGGCAELLRSNKSLERTRER